VGELPQPEVPEHIRKSPPWYRLEEQLGWYDSKSNYCQTRYKWLKFLQIALGASIPLLVYQVDAKAITAAVGVIIAILEAVQHLNQYSTLWVEYRSTAEYLKHERWLFLARSGEYRGLNDDEALKLLAEQVESHVSTQHTTWTQKIQSAVQRSSQPHAGVR